MKKNIALVLGGGASRGAMQAGALRALFEAGFRPDLVTGASIGAANGAFLAVNGFNLEGAQKLEQVWRSVAGQDILPTRFWWQTMLVFFASTKGVSQQRVREFAIAHGLAPDLRFRDLQNVKFYPVATDLSSGCPIIFGQDPDESVLESVLASMSLPPWMAPVENKGHLLVDGGFVSNLPIEAALRQGAGEIIALDLFDPNDLAGNSHGFGDFFLKLDRTVENHQTQLEIELAQARGVPVWRIPLIAEKPAPIWEFSRSDELIERGYQLARLATSQWASRGGPTRGRENGIKAAVAEFIEALG